MRNTTKIFRLLNEIEEVSFMRGSSFILDSVNACNKNND